ncbi:MAG: class I SAM-dependent methyltransferase [Gammaproteobacteria bacterium]|nr:class I SAM-dependent methyltransferase [Gammaproteobacteria bacterium]
MNVEQRYILMSYLSLEKHLEFKKPLPIVEHWSAAADFLSVIADYCLQEKPQTIVECSSGISSLVLSQCCMLNQSGHVYSLENGADYVRQTQQRLAGFSLSDYCDVIHAPLQEVPVDEQVFQWYGLSELPELEIDLLVIDGPPGFLQKQSRFPALPLLQDKMAEKCTIFLDDAARDDEQELVKRWLNMCPEFNFEYIDNDRGCSVLRRNVSSQV